MAKILKIEPVNASTDIKISKTNIEDFDYIQIIGFENAYYITIDFTSEDQMYGAVLFESQKGKAIVRLNGYDDISTS